MIGKRLFVSIVAALVVTTGILVADARSSNNADWEAALAVRSQELNERYGLAEAQPRERGGADAAWMKALMTRSRALNRKYGLGQFAPTPSRATPAWYEALMARSEALNRKYHLGQYAP